MVVLLTNAGSTTPEKTSTGKTPLWYACIAQHKGCVEFLLRYPIILDKLKFSSSKLKFSVPLIGTRMTPMICLRMKSLFTIS